VPVLGEEVERRAPRDPAELLVVQPEVFGDDRRKIFRRELFSHGRSGGGAHVG